MNDRIKELETQCWEPRQYGPACFNSEKFAKLIIQECIDIAHTEGDKIDYLKTYFGVE